MAGLSRFGLSNTNKYILFADFLSSQHQIQILLEHLSLSNDMVESAQPLDINALHNVHVVEELIQLTIGPNAEIIANSH